MRGYGGGSLREKLERLFSESPLELETRISGLRRLRPVLLGDGHAEVAYRRLKRAGVPCRRAKLPLESLRPESNSLYVYGHVGESPSFQQVTKALKGGRVICFQQLYALYPEVFLPHCYITEPGRLLGHKNEILRAFDCWRDARSRQVFLAHLRFRLFQLPILSSRLANGPLYFRSELVKRDEKAVYYDCGAFDGGTIFEFLAYQRYAFNRIVAFEPDERNFAELRKRVSAWPASLSKKIELVNKAVSGREGYANFDGWGREESRLDSHGRRRVETVPLDAFAKRGAPTLIKLDVEGAEGEALLGARSILRKNRTALAVCAYHRPEDLWKLPLLIRKINPDYRLYLRATASYGDELVVYAVPPLSGQR